MSFKREECILIKFFILWTGWSTKNDISHFPVIMECQSVLTFFSDLDFISNLCRGLSPQVCGRKWRGSYNLWLCPGISLISWHWKCHGHRSRLTSWHYITITMQIINDLTPQPGSSDHRTRSLTLSLQFWFITLISIWCLMSISICGQQHFQYE